MTTNVLSLLVACIGFMLIVVLLTSVFTKKASSELILSDRFVDKYGSSASVIETCAVSLSLLIVYLISIGATRTSGVLILFMMVCGEMLRRADIVAHCNCFGSLGQGSLRGFVAGFTIIAASCLVLLGDHTPVISSEKLMFAAIICATLMSVWLPSMRENSQSEILPGGPHVVDGTLVIGSLGDEEVEFFQVSQDCPLVVFAGLSQHCGTCRDLKPALLKISQALDEYVRIVFLVQGKVEENEYPEDSIVLKANESFVKTMTSGAYPFAFAVDARTGNRIGDTDYGTHIANLILKAAAVSMQASSAGQAERQA